MQTMVQLYGYMGIDSIKQGMLALCMLISGITFLGCSEIAPEKYEPAENQINNSGSVRIAVIGYELYTSNEKPPLDITRDVNLEERLLPVSIFINGAIVRPSAFPIETRNLEDNAYLAVEIPDSYLPTKKSKVVVRVVVKGRPTLADTLSFDFSPERRLLIKIDSLFEFTKDGSTILQPKPFLSIEDLSQEVAPSPGYSKLRFTNQGGFTARLVKRNPVSGLDETLFSGITPGSTTQYIEVEQGSYTSLRIADQDEQSTFSLPIAPSVLQGGSLYTALSYSFTNVNFVNIALTGLGLDAPLATDLTAKVTLVHAHPYLSDLSLGLSTENTTLTFSQSLPYNASAGPLTINYEGKALPVNGQLIAGDNALAFLLPKTNDSTAVQVVLTSARNVLTGNYLVRFINASPDAGPVTFTSAVTTGGGLTPYLDYLPDTLRMANRGYLEMGAYQTSFNPSGTSYKQAIDPYVSFTSPPRAIRVRRFTGKAIQPGDVFLNVKENPFIQGPGVYTVVLVGSARYNLAPTQRYTNILVFRHSL
jgi:hypothetical protein